MTTTAAGLISIFDWLPDDLRDKVNSTPSSESDCLRDSYDYRVNTQFHSLLNNDVLNAEHYINVIISDIIKDSHYGFGSSNYESRERNKIESDADLAIYSLRVKESRSMARAVYTFYHMNKKYQDAIIKRIEDYAYDRS